MVVILGGEQTKIHEETGMQSAGGVRREWRFRRLSLTAAKNASAQTALG